jgi:hypothetical protein
MPQVIPGALPHFFWNRWPKRRPQKDLFVVLGLDEKVLDVVVLRTPDAPGLGSANAEGLRASLLRPARGDKVLVVV